VLVVQCPPNMRYENREMGTAVAEITRHVIANWPIDEARVHLTGMSMGGEGVWHAVAEGPGLFATVTPLGGRSHPDPDAVAKAMKGTTAWVIVGDRDGDFTSGSQKMVDTFREQGVDVVHTVLPGFGHNIWRAMMSKRQYYEMIMLHSRDQSEPPKRPSGMMSKRQYYEMIMLHSRDQSEPPKRPSGEKLREIAFLPPEDEREAEFTKQTTEKFEKWLPYWQIENCGRKGGVGPHDRFGRGEDVFLTHPLSPLTPCRLMTTWKLPEGKKSKLVVRAGSHPRGDWKLIIRVNNEIVVEQDIRRDEETGDIYQSFEVDLTEFAGRETPIQLFNQATGWGREYAVWDTIEIISE